MYRSLTERRLTNFNTNNINAQADELEKIAAHVSAVFDCIGHPVPAEYLKDYPIVLKSREVWDLMIAERAATAATGVPPQGTSR